MALISRVIVSLTFLVAAILKLADPAGMFFSILSYKLVGGHLALAGAYLFPAMELWAALGLWWRPTRVASATLIAGMLILFIAVIISAWARGLDFACGCFGTGSHDDPALLLLRDVALLVLTLDLLRRDLKAQGLSRLKVRYSAHTLPSAGQ